MKSIFLISSLVGCICLSSGCANTPIGQFTLSDAQAASSLAKAENDSQAQGCYDYIANSLMVEAASNVTPGLLYLNQLRRDYQNSFPSLLAACQTILPLKAVPVIAP